MADQQEEQWLQQAQEGDARALQAGLEMHNKLIWQVAHHFGGGDPNDLGDMVQEARIAFLTAVREFKSGGTARFTTYAFRAMYRACRRANERVSNPYSVSLKVLERRRRCSAAEDALTKELGREPTEKEIMTAAGVTAQQREEIKAIPANVLSFDFIYETGGQLGDFVEVPHGDGGLTQWFERRWLEQELSRLPAREAQIIRDWCGWDGEELGLSEIGQRMGVKRQRVFQLRERGLKILRERCRAQQ